LTDLETLALTLYGETRGEPHDGKIAVANVIKNRATLHSQTIGAVCLCPHQFSCWQLEAQTLAEADRRLVAGTPDPPLVECERVAAGVIAGTVVDNTNGATHYYAPAVMVPPGRVPTWAAGLTPCATVGHHLFFNNVDHAVFVATHKAAA
jgi:cell wall hydrolase